MSRLPFRSAAEIDAGARESGIRVPADTDAARGAAGARPPEGGVVIRPTIVCLCGSTRFKDDFIAANFRETMAGKIVLSVGWFSHADREVYSPTPEEKAALDELHLAKIDLSDEVLVINPGGYIGDSTRREIEHARATCKPIRWLEEAGHGDQ